MTARQDVLGSSSSASIPFSIPLIEVVVGSGRNKSPFLIHPGIICPRSEFFKHTMNSNWKYPDNPSIELPEEEPYLFSIYQDLIYTNILPTSYTALVNSEFDESYSRVYVDVGYYELCALYILAEKLVDETAKAYILNAVSVRFKQDIIAGSNCYPSMDCIRLIYNGTQPLSKARSLMVDFYTGFGDTTWLSDDIGNPTDIPRDFLYDIAVSMLPIPLPQRDEEATDDHHSDEGTIENNEAIISELQAELKLLEKESYRLETIIGKKYADIEKLSEVIKGQTTGL